MSALDFVAFVAEVRRLVVALHEGAPTYYSARPVALTHHAAERPEPGPKKPALRARWEASCGHCTVTGETPEEAASALISRLRGDLAKKIADHRAALAQLEAAQGGGLRVVRAEQPS